ncbi:hypothetical protein [Pseudooceanicola nanhaiensis]|uniref:hypothetical protein n=1 Tax=Pseudooceanicola nanhaiensis TaxID=375761 RepID=UPI001CD2FD01|nr:hypothetical protein [Pseudooceanicola nanhaiensis]MCA0922775.1 hypothetical protein [Pseudooceanicola nanhaiensis]
METDKIAKPFVIWTLQRTGGTNLHSFLNRNSAFQKVQDEPFNGRREYGHLTRDWKASKDTEALDKGMKDVCALQRNIKHCVERVPMAVSKSLATASVEAGYVHLFLYRENPTGRLLSMEYAERTRSWGPSRTLEPGADAEAFEEPLDVAKLVAHETEANDKLNKCWRALKKAGAKAATISYEELYAGDEDTARTALQRLFDGFGFAVDAEKLTEATEAVRGRGDQQTRDRYASFKGIETLKEGISGIPPLVFSRTAT